MKTIGNFDITYLAKIRHRFHALILSLILVMGVSTLCGTILVTTQRAVTKLTFAANTLHFFVLVNLLLLVALHILVSKARAFSAFNAELIVVVEWVWECIIAVFRIQDDLR